MRISWQFVGIVNRGSEQNALVSLTVFVTPRPLLTSNAKRPTTRTSTIYSFHCLISFQSLRKAVLLQAGCQHRDWRPGWVSDSLCLSEWSKPRRFAYFCLLLSVMIVRLVVALPNPARSGLSASRLAIWLGKRLALPLRAEQTETVRLLLPTAFDMIVPLVVALPDPSRSGLSASRRAIWLGKRSVSLCLSERSKPRRFAYFCLQLSFMIVPKSCSFSIFFSWP